MGVQELVSQGTSLHRQGLALVAALSLPILCLAVLTVLRLAQAEREMETTQHLGMARAISAAVDRELLKGQSALLALSTSLGLVTTLDTRTGQTLFVALTGVLILAWAQLAWHATPRAEPFGAAANRLVDRSVTAVGTFFAIALWAKYAPQASAGFSRTSVLVLCGVGLMAGLLVGSRGLQPRTPLFRRR